MALDPTWIRNQFPALAQTVQGHPAVFFDGPGGTQVPHTVLQAMQRYLIEANANAHGAFITSERTDHTIAAARSAIADFLSCSPQEVVFGANMTTLTFALSRALGRTWQAGDEIVVTRLDHDANVTPWAALAEQGLVIRTVDLDPEDCTLDFADLERQLSDRTRLVAVGYASNAVGTINNVAAVVQLAHAVGALVFVDAVHYAPHGPIDVRALDCDFLACSGYKFFGPHVGILYGKAEHLAQFQPYKLRPSPNEVPYRWETGTHNHEGLAGLVAAVDYLAELGRQVAPDTTSRQAALKAVMTEIQAYEQNLSGHLISGLLKIPGLQLYGMTDRDRLHQRTPTVGIRLVGQSPYDVAKALGDRGIFTWHGNFYAINLTERLGLEAQGGLLRIGLVHYNTTEEIERFLQTLHEIAAPSAMSRA